MGVSASESLRQGLHGRHGGAPPFADSYLPAAVIRIAGGFQARDQLRDAGYAEYMSGAAAKIPPPGRRRGTWRTAELLCALSFGSGLAAAERMEHGTNTAFVGIQLSRAPAGDKER